MQAASAIHVNDAERATDTWHVARRREAVWSSNTDREFRDVVFEDVGLENNCLSTLKTEGVETSHLKLIWARG